MLGINGSEFVLLIVVALVVVGPERLPRYAEQLGVWVRTARSYALTARTRVTEELGEDVADVDWAALDPRRYDPRRIVREALLDDLPPAPRTPSSGATAAPRAPSSSATAARAASREAATAAAGAAGAAAAGATAAGTGAGTAAATAAGAATAGGPAGDAQAGDAAPAGPPSAPYDDEAT